ncbi:MULTISPECIES: PssD/Cps14F family polysaccharide biosynthesis glycosyltransferase [Clostridium]|uniref:PssD/Cps14F family polysaccharide biosynthesis glycosyltransferase n=1 Tax=Clostridium TaxID=1485 RepID=UPI0022DEAB31|nr:MULTISPECIES: PssD/Cps14F family polysaccharide biosynthesis glycosyltransferase [Clostridium]MDU6542643.1 PssD/Cps14F family polysaccharide biosynthesis glycosyltransferase [Clostridium sp.]
MEITHENKEKSLKICLVGSSGGHLTHLYMLKSFWNKCDRFWVTFDKEDAKSLLEGEKVYPCYYPTNRNIKNLIKNTFLAFKVLKRENPDIVISSGAAVAVPFFYLSKLKGKKTIYIEVYDRVDKPTITGRLVYPIVDKFIVQWEEQKKVYPKAINLGSIF